jgi:hypothetical protein
MAFAHHVLTLSGVAQRLSDVYGDGVGVVNAAHDIPLRQIIFAADPANGAVVYVGGDNTVSSTDHGFSLDPTQASSQPVAVGPFSTGPVKLSDFWVLGTGTQRLMIGVVPY